MLINKTLKIWSGKTLFWNPKVCVLSTLVALIFKIQSLLLLLIYFSVRTLERAKATGNFASESSEGLYKGDSREYQDSESDLSDTEVTRNPRRKKLKVAGVGLGSL